MTPPPVLPLVLLMFAAVTAASTDEDAGAGAAADSCQLVVSPTTVEGLTVGTYLPLFINCSCCDTSSEPGWILAVRALMSNSQIAAVTASSRRERQSHTSIKRTCSYGDICTFKEFPCPLSGGLFIEANNVGRTSILVSLRSWNATSWPDLLLARRTLSAAEEGGGGGAASAASAAATAAASGQQLDSQEISIVTLRKQRAIDRAFEWSIGLIACVLALCMGCMTDLREVRPFYRRPLSLVTCLIAQHLFMPPIALGLYKLFSVTADMGFGLITIATMPGGGMAHLTVFLMSGDRNLSAAISLMNAVLNLGLSPAWLSLFTRYLQFSILYHRLLLWLLVQFICQLAGSLVATCRPNVAQAALNWVGRPILLLSAILMVTLGIYINHYAIDHLDPKALGCVLVFIATGFFLGGLASFIIKVDKPRRKTLAAETACSACLIAIPAIRMSCENPTADLATIMPLAAAILTPAPIVLYVVSHRIKVWIAGFIDKRKEKQSRHFSIVSSLAKMAEDVTAASAPLVLDEGTANEGQTEKQKVTTL